MWLGSMDKAVQIWGFRSITRDLFSNKKVSTQKADTIQDFCAE